jgi:hypothetical protein
LVYDHVLTLLNWGASHDAFGTIKSHYAFGTIEKLSWGIVYSGTLCNFQIIGTKVVEFRMIFLLKINSIY